MFGFFNLFNRVRPQQEYVLTARYRAGHWMRQFEVTASSPYEAARKFDTGDNDQWIRVSSATIKQTY